MSSHTEIRKRNIAEKRFYCQDCDKAFQEQYTLDRHLKSHFHVPKESNYKIYSCDLCDFKTRIKKSFEIHEETKKHKKRLEEKNQTLI